MTLAPNMYLLRFNNKVSNDYIFHIIIDDKFQLDLLKQIASSTLSAINKDNLRSINILLPQSLQEQQKIAEILSTVDEAIEKTDALIEKYKKIKT
jgi:type I restriction enzyme S subunit